jgi:PII-like signaling protein
MILVSERIRRERRPVHTEIVARAREAGLAEVTVLRGLDGHIGTSRRSSRGLLRRPDNVPVAVIIVDQEERLRRFLTYLAEITEDCIVTLDTAEAFRYGRADSEARNRGRRDAG